MDINQKYWNTISICQLIITPCTCLSAGIYYTSFRMNGVYTDTPWRYVILFDCTQILYLLIAICLMVLNKKKIIQFETYIRLIKWFITVSLLIQYCFVMILFQTIYTLACTFLFLFFVMFCFDFKLMVANVIFYALIASITHTHYIRTHMSEIQGNYLQILIFEIIISVIYCFLCIVITYFMEKFIKGMQAEENENNYLSSRQLHYYQNLDLMDRELRRFRHDITNHFLVMQELINREDTTQFKQYFSNLSNDYSESNQLYFSGNVVVDSILNYDISHLCNDTVKSVVYGRLPKITTVSAMDLCTVFSNMLSNAIKGANRLKEENELVIQFQSGDKYFSITIINQLDDKEISEKNHKNKVLEANGKTDVRNNTMNKHHKKDREDVRNHGFGVINIQRITEKYGGIFEQGEEPDTNTFSVHVYLPI